MQIDTERCLKAMEWLNVEGAPTGHSTSPHPSDKRSAVFADAIAAIQNDGSVALRSVYLGIKNYASFGDQRNDSEYGMGPRHGSIVFRIGRTHSGLGTDSVLCGDHVYLLECVRDFGTREVDEVRDGRKIQLNLNLCDVLRRLQRARESVAESESWLAEAVVESHEAA